MAVQRGQNEAVSATETGGAGPENRDCGPFQRTWRHQTPSTANSVDGTKDGKGIPDPVLDDDALRSAEDGGGAVFGGADGPNRRSSAKREGFGESDCSILPKIRDFKEAVSIKGNGEDTAAIAEELRPQTPPTADPAELVADPAVPEAVGQNPGTARLDSHRRYPRQSPAHPADLEKTPRHHVLPETAHVQTARGTTPSRPQTARCRSRHAVHPSNTRHQAKGTRSRHSAVAQMPTDRASETTNYRIGHQTNAQIQSTAQRQRARSMH